MKNKKCFLSAIILISSLCSCDKVQDDSKTNSESNMIESTISNQDGITPYKSVVSEGGKAGIVNRRQIPQLMLSTLLRTDLLITADFLKTEDMEDYFAICKETGMNTIELSVMWSQIEKEKDVYDFTDIKNYLNFAKKYDLKVNIEWYGSLTDGETHSVNIPNYINDNPSTYPVIVDLFDFAYFGRCKILDWSNDSLLARERKAIYEMMNYVYDWNQENDLYDPVVMVQIGQGADRFQRWRVEAYKVKDSTGNLMTSEDSWKMVNTYLNEIAKGVKYSKYKALTRAEFCEQNAVVNYVREIKKLENIDLVCPTYLHTMPAVKNGIKSFSDEYPDMPIMNVENWADDNNYRQILASMAMNGMGYASYQLSCPNYYPESPNGALYGRYDSSKESLNEKFTERNNRATNTKQINTALNKAYIAIANAPRANFAAFGLNNLLNNGLTAEDRLQKIFMNNGLLFEFSNPADSIGFAVYDKNFVYAFSSKDATLTINNCSITVAQKGYFDTEGQWVNEQSATLESNKILKMEKDIVYRIRIASISDLPSLDELDKQKYKGTLDSIRG